jgi:hypothetical protein
MPKFTFDERNKIRTIATLTKSLSSTSKSVEPNPAAAYYSMCENEKKIEIRRIMKSIVDTFNFGH